MQTSTKRGTPFEAHPDRGAVATVSHGHTNISVSGSDVEPAQSLADRGQLYFSAKRFLARPEIGDVFSWGTNGLSCRPPQSDAARLNLYRCLPQPEACHRLEVLLTEAIAQPATPTGIRQAVAASIGAFPSGAKADPIYKSNLVDLLTEEAHIAGWYQLAVIGGLIRIVRNSTFLPAIPEVFEAIDAAREEIWSARVFAEKAQEVFQELEDRLIWAGLLTFDFDYDAGWETLP